MGDFPAPSEYGCRSSHLHHEMVGGKRALDLEGVQLHAICKWRPLYDGERRSIVQALMFGLATLKLLLQNSM